jgi:hypothetical protein
MFIELTGAALSELMSRRLGDVRLKIGHPSEPRIPADPARHFTERVLY